MYKIKQKKVYNYKKKKYEEEVLIVEVNKDNNVSYWIPSPLTSYIYIKYSSVSINTKIIVATAVVDFVNFIIDKVEEGYDSNFNILKEKGLSGLTLYHLAEYLNYISREKKNKYETVVKKDIY